MKLRCIITLIVGLYFAIASILGIILSISWLVSNYYLSTYIETTIYTNIIPTLFMVFLFWWFPIYYWLSDLALVCGYSPNGWSAICYSDGRIVYGASLILFLSILVVSAFFLVRVWKKQKTRDSYSGA